MSHHTAKKALWTKGSEEFVVQISVGLGSWPSQTENVEFKVKIYLELVFQFKHSGSGVMVESVEKRALRAP